jgi:hypothetical protein
VDVATFFEDFGQFRHVENYSRKKGRSAAARTAPLGRTPPQVTESRRNAKHDYISNLAVSLILAVVDLFLVHAQIVSEFMPNRLVDDPTNMTEILLFGGMRPRIFFRGIQNGFLVDSHGIRHHQSAVCFPARSDRNTVVVTKECLVL